MFSKILIANRGEIVVRIAATCRKMGIATVAAYSEADRNALHVRACDEAYPIGAAPAPESYLRADRIIEAALKSGAQAIHPGYGFLSENADFARAVESAGLVWIGPPPAAIELLGSKIESKKLAERVGVPVVPGYMGEDQSPQRLGDEAVRIGFPVLIKASAGGGGKGMRVVRSAADMPESVAAAQREAQAAFGDSAVLLEKYLEEPRHIEVQILGDHFGSVVHLGERECSIQRRHQKVVEESPSPVITPELREQLTASAVALARAAGYTNAGTVEFIFKEGQFYFLEVNTRLQVEHPVTETALGLDLVEAQIRVANGEPLPFKQEDIQFKAHAFEARLYAEDPAHDFLPSTGQLTRFVIPGGCRVDTGYEEGDAVTPYYDPMLAKIITSGPDRQASLLAMQSALSELVVEGPRTNLDFLRWLFSRPEFARGELSTDFISRYYSPGSVPEVPAQVFLAGGAVFALSSSRVDERSPWPWSCRPWRQARQSIPARFTVEGTSFACVYSALDDGYWHAEISSGDRGLYSGRCRIHVGRANSDQSGYVILQIGEAKVEDSIPFERGGDGTVLISREGRKYALHAAAAVSTNTLGHSLHPTDEDTLESPMPGKVLRVLVAEGEPVDEEQPLLIVEAMKMEFMIRAPHAGTVAAIHYPEGSQVAVGDVLVELRK